MDCTVVSSTGTTVRRRKAGRTRNTSGNSIFTGAVRARSVTAARREAAHALGELLHRGRQRRPERLGAGERRDRAAKIGQIEPLGRRAQLVAPPAAEVHGPQHPARARPRAAPRARRPRAAARATRTDRPRRRRPADPGAAAARRPRRARCRLDRAASQERRRTPGDEADDRREDRDRRGARPGRATASDAASDGREPEQHRRRCLGGRGPDGSGRRRATARSPARPRSTTTLLAAPSPANTAGVEIVTRPPAAATGSTGRPGPAS